LALPADIDWNNKKISTLNKSRDFLVGDGLILLRLRSRTRVQLRAALCRLLDVTSWHAPRSNQEARQDVPSWNSLSMPRYREKDVIYIYFVYAVLQCLSPRAAGMESKIVFV
jgi:hypothetical protein